MATLDAQIAQLERSEAFAVAQGRRQNALDARRKLAMLRAEQAAGAERPEAPVESGEQTPSRIETAGAKPVAEARKSAARRKRAAAKSTD